MHSCLDHRYPVRANSVTKLINDYFYRYVFVYGNREEDKSQSKTIGENIGPEIDRVSQQ